MISSPAAPPAGPIPDSAIERATARPIDRTRAVRARPRVAVVYPTPFGDDGIYGGGERYAVELARALAAFVPTRMVTFGERARRERLDGLDGLEVRVHAPLRYVGGVRNNPFTLTFLADLADVDVVHCVIWNTLTTDLAVLFARLAGKRVFVTDVGGGAGVTLHRYLPLARWVDGWLLIAEQGGRQFTDYRDRWSILYAGIDIQRFRPGDGPRDGVLFVGRLVPHKGVDVLIRAVEPGVPLRIAGRIYHEEYFRLLQRLAEGKDVTFFTAATDDEVLALYRSATVSVLPSVNRTVYGDTTELPELLGFAAMEAMACGTPVVCSRVGGMAEVVVDGETGYLVPPSDPAALGERLRRLLDDPAHAAALGAAARRRIVERFTWEQVARRCLAAYDA